jgi:hypothetical protein
MLTANGGDPWAALARHARDLADLTDQLASQDPVDRPKIGNLTEHADRVLDLAKTCQYDTYRVLSGGAGWTVQQIADHCGSSYWAVYEVFGRVGGVRNG